MILKTIFLQILSSNFFSVLVGCFFDTLTFYCQKTKIIAQTPKQMNKYNFSQKNNF